MEGKVLYVVLALVASSIAASISGMASVDLNQASAGGQVTFPRIPGINSPLFGFRPTQSSTTNSPQGGFPNSGIGSIFSHIPGISNFFPGTSNRNGNNNSNTTNGTNSNTTNGTNSNTTNGTNSNTTNGTDTNSTNSTNTISTNGNNDSNPTRIPGFPNINNFASAIPGLGNFIPGFQSGFDIEGMISRIPGLNGNRTNGTNFIVPSFPQLPDINDGPYIPGVSEALREARQHLQAMLNITSDISTGMRDVIQTALGSEHPADSIRIILNTIAKVYGTVAMNCPLIIIGERVFHEGVRLGFEVIRSLGNVAVGPQNNIINSLASG